MPQQGRLFLVMSNQVAMDQLLSLWARYSAGDQFPCGFACWRAVFDRLKNIRRWDTTDRFAERQTVERWRDVVALGQRAIDGGQLTEPVPYALALTLETRPNVQLPIYQEIRQRIRPQVPVIAGTP